MGGKTGTSTSTVQIPPEVLARYNAVNAKAENVAQTPFQAYSQNANDFVAPLTGTQRQAIGQIGQASTMAQPYFQTGAAATMAGMGPANLGELNTQQYMSPYLQNVVQNTADIIGQQNQQAMSGALGTAIGAGAGWGDRSGIAAANLARQQQMGLGSTIGNLLNQGYMQAQGVAQQQQSADLAARQANLARLMQGGQGLGQLGAGAQGSALAGAQALMGAGTQEQQTEQAGKSALYNQYQQMRAYPFQVAQFLANIAEGTGALSGSTTTETKPVGFFSGFKKGGKVIDGSYRRGGLAPESMGGHVGAEHMGEGYADGGAPADYSSMVIQQLFGGGGPEAGAYGMNKSGLGAASYVPQGNLPVGQLNPSKISEGGKQTTATDLVNDASSLANTAEKAGQLWDKYGPKPSFDTMQSVGDISNKLSSFLMNRGGAIRPGLAVGGMPYGADDTGYVPDNTPDKAPQLLQAKTSNDNSPSDLSKIMDVAKIAAMFMANGGAADSSYEVQKGDTLWGIAKKHGMSLDDLVKANSDIKDPNRIGIGQRINLPQNAPVEPVVPMSRSMRPGLVPAATGDVSSFAPKQGGAVLSPDYQFPTAGFVPERAFGNYASRPDQEHLANMLQLEAMGRRPEAQQGNLYRGGYGDGLFLGSDYPSDYNPGYATGGVAGRHGYDDGGFASDDALAELARKKREQDILGELGSSQWSGLAPASQPAATPVSAPTGITNARSTNSMPLPGPAVSKAEAMRDPIKYRDVATEIFGPEDPNASPLTKAGRLTAGLAGNVLPAVVNTAANFGQPFVQAKDLLTMTGPEFQAAYATNHPTAQIHPGLTPPASTQPAVSGLAAAAGTPTAGYEPPAAPAVTANLPMAKAPLDLTTGKGLVPTPPQMSAPLNIRNNNPGNIKDSDFARSQPGYVGNNGEFAVFKTPEDGRNAQAALLGSYVDRGFDTISKIVNRWSPPNAPGNSPESTNNYIAYIAKKAGLDPNQPLTKDDIPKILDAQAEFEGGSTGGVRTGAAGLGGNDIAAGRVQVANAPQGGLANANVSAPSATMAETTPAGGGGGDGKGFDWSSLLLPALAGIGKMAGSQSRYLGTALLEGIGGGAEAYMNRQAQLADINQKKATALNSVSLALSNMLVNDGRGNLFVPLQGGGYEPLYSYINNPDRKPSVMGPEIDKVLSEIGAGNFSSVGKLTQIAQQGVNAGVPAPVEAPSNIIWDDSADADVEATRANYGRNIQTPANLDESSKILTGAESDASAAMRSRKMLRNNARTLVEAIASGNTGSLNGYINTNILGPISSIMNRLGMSMPAAEDPVSQMQILEKNSTMLATNATSAAEQRAVEALNIMKGATPGVDLTKAANAEIMASMLQQNQDAMDRRNFYSYYQNKTGGLLQGAEASYNDHYAGIQAKEHEELRKLFEMASTDPRVVKIMNIAASGAPFNDVQGLLTTILGNDISPVLARYLTGGT